MGSLQDYVNSTRKIKPTPKDPYAHAAFLLGSEQEAISEFNQIISNEAKLSFIRDDRLLRLYQKDITYLVALFAMARRDPDMREVFLNLYYGWLGELAITRAKDGTERKLQGSVGQTGYSPKDTLQGGYGLGLPPLEQHDQKGNILSRLLPQRRQE